MVRKTKRHAEIIQKIRECLNDTGLRLLEEIHVRTTIAEREVLILQRMLEKRSSKKKRVLSCQKRKSKE